MTTTVTTERPRITFSDLAGFTSKQWQAFDAARKYKYFLFGGSRGPGKSYVLRWAPVYQLIEWATRGHRGVRALLACEDYPTLRKRQIVKVQAEFPPWLGRYYAGERKEFVLNDAYGGGVIEFGNLKDIGNYLSSEYAWIGVDELVRNTFSTFTKLRGSLRWPGIEDTRFMGATNPEANWVRTLWIERRFDGEFEHLADLADKFHFVAGYPADNPHLSKSYWQDLMSMPKSLQQAWVHGDWYAAVEGLVYDTFSGKNITEDEPDPERPYEIAIDDGYIDPRAVLFIQRSGSQIFIFDEIYHTKRLEEETIEEIVRRCDAPYWGEEERPAKLRLPELAAVSHEAVALRRRLREADIPARNWMARKAGGGKSTRLEAIKTTRQLMCDGRGVRVIKVHKRCRHLLDEIMAGYKYPEDTKGKRGMNEHPADGNDHAAEALSAWCWLRAR